MRPKGKQMNPDMSDQEETSPAANAVSLFGQSGGVNDFPVLKAFQEYIDAEQAKARKRMFGLSIFFIVLLVVVVVTFTIIMTSVISRNQALSDRLLDIALREKPAAQPVVNVQPPVPSPVVQPVLQPSVESAELARLREELQREKEARQAEQAKRDKEKIESLTAALAKAQQQPVAPTPVVVTTSPASLVQPATESAELVRLREELRRAKEERKAELDKAKEKKRQAEIEAHRRRLYPEYYAQEDARKAAAAAEALRPAEPVEPQRRAAPPLPAPKPVPVVRPSQPPVQQPPPPARISQPVPAKPSQTPAQAQKLKTLKPVTYFNDVVPDEDPELKELFKQKPPSQPAPTSAPVAKPAAQPVPEKPVPAVKPPSPPAVKPPAQPVAVKPAPTKPAPAAPVPPQPAAKTETLAIGGTTDGSSIPWLIELPQN